ncbi:hypothetical protein CKO31_02015 [Thiohalocapsa halophila]|uniref:DUF58 domain-containing protein n=1 Tax=Thiohalocapsa halophila TaxID=69359 RepID=A0ABS1CCJ3_9GAMM|nr:DUF58 domain-containing protein [Thiohalocapsa halophila]MBK1629532.1 hypothetical protein [Thiohalocapsa halophila]
MSTSATDSVDSIGVGAAAGLRAQVARAVSRLRRKRATEPSSAVAATHHRSIYILPTKAGIGYGLVLLATLLGALNYQNNLGLLLTFLMIAIALVGMHHCWFQLLGLEVRARDGLAVFAGETARFPVTLADKADKPRPQLAIVGAAPVSLAAGGEAQLELPRAAARRGVLTLQRVVLETRYPFGLFRAWAVLRPQARVLVYPKPAPRAPQPPMLARFDQQARGDLGTGAEDFVGPRAYRRGDSPRQLDWKAFARERGLVVKQFGGDQSARVWLDWDALPAPDPEQRLSLLARQVLDADALNYSYGLRLPGVSIDQGRGGRHKHRCLGALARLATPEQTRHG